MFFSTHNHLAEGSNLRLRDSINRIEDMLDYAEELGYSGLCITEHESVVSSLDSLKHFKEWKKEKPGREHFKLGLGNEIYLCPSTVNADNKTKNIYPHFILIACDELGHKCIRELSTNSWINNSFMHVMYRVPTYYTDLEKALKEYKGHLIGQSACLGGSIPMQLLKYKDSGDKTIINKCISWIDFMNEIFGKGYFFLELQPGETEEQKYVNQKLIKLSEITDTPYIFSTDSHYLKKEDRPIHKAYLNAEDGDREVDEFYASTYMMSEKEIHSFTDYYLGEDVVQKGIDNTKLIFDKIQFYELEKPLHIPYIPLDLSEPDKTLFDKYKDKIPLLTYFFFSIYDSDRHMIREVMNGIERNQHYQSPQGYVAVQECLMYLQTSSDKMKVRWSAYLMQVRDYVKLAWEAGSLVGLGRGSGAGFCLLYLLDILEVDPLREKTKMFPWRFMNPSRKSILDIDIDVEGVMRDTVINKFREVYGIDRVSKVMTLTTEKARSAILTAGRGLGFDNDLTSYIASLIVSDRGNPRSLKVMYYGDKENDIKPVQEFVNEMDTYPELWETAQKIEGLVSGVGSHAGGVIIVDEPFTETTALMRTKSGEVITQFDLHMCEDVSLIKVDILCIDALDKIHVTLNLLLKHNIIQWQGGLKDTYEKYLNPYVLERDAEDMWRLLWEHKVISLFQMEKESGKQALALVKPQSVDDLAAINSVIRLMPQDKNAERPLEKFARFRFDITNWYREMEEYGLTQEEQDVLKPILSISYGICEAQERFMQLVQLPEAGGFSLDFADTLRRAIAKKNPEEYEQITKQFFKETKEKGCSEKFCDYVWNVLIATSRGYGFNLAHCLSYSLIGLQELNLNYRYDSIYWQTANIIVDSGSYDKRSNDSTNYDKMAVAIATAQAEKVKIQHPLVNKADFSFEPNAKEHTIIFGLKGINSINTNISQWIINNRNFDLLYDFCDKAFSSDLIKNNHMFKLIKAGVFDEFNTDRKVIMKQFIDKYIFTPVDNLSFKQFSKCRELDIIPNELKLSADVFDFKKEVLQDSNVVEEVIIPDKKIPKCGYHDRLFVLNAKTQKFFESTFSELSVERIQNQYFILSEKKFKKECETLLQPLREWFNGPETLEAYNQAVFNQLWEKHASGTVEQWSMEALSYYDGKHELDGINEERYGIVNYNDLPEEPVAYDYWTQWIDGIPKKMPKYEISRLAGTILAVDNNHSSITLLTTYGLCNVKMPKGTFAFYKRQISRVIDAKKGTKEVIEKPWIKRGNKIIVCGIRRGDQFWTKKYKDTVYKHTINLIKQVNEDGSLELQVERTKVN